MNAVNNLKNKMDSAKEPREKIAIRYIMRQVNKAYDDYIKEISISESDRRDNMNYINMKMAA
jgi:hypothetical protein